MWFGTTRNAYVQLKARFAAVLPSLLILVDECVHKPLILQRSHGTSQVVLSFFASMVYL